MIELSDDHFVIRTPFAAETAGEVKGERRHILPKRDLV